MPAPSPDRAKLLFAPLESYTVWLLRRDGIEPTTREIGERLGVTAQTVFSYRIREFVAPQRADEMAIAAGVHPSYIWGDAWWDACAHDARIDEELAYRKQQATYERKRKARAQRRAAACLESAMSE